MESNGPPKGMVMLQPMSFDNEPVKHVLTIKPGNNGWAVFVEEDVKVKRSISSKDIKNQIGDIVETINSASGEGNEIDKIYRANDKKADPDALPAIKLGMYIFKTIEEMQGFISFVYENQVIEMKEAEIAAKLAEEKLKPRFNSQMKS